MSRLSHHITSLSKLLDSSLCQIESLKKGNSLTTQANSLDYKSSHVPRNAAVFMRIWVLKLIFAGFSKNTSDNLKVNLFPSTECLLEIFSVKESIFQTAHTEYNII